MRHHQGPGYWITLIDDEKQSDVTETVWVPQPESPVVQIQDSLDDLPQRSTPPDPFTPIGLIAQCRACNRNRDLHSFYEPNQVFTACRECRRTGIAVTTVKKYECPCGSIVLNRERHETATKKHRAWKRRTNR